MVRVRFYSLVLSLPILVVVTSVVMALAFDVDLRVTIPVLVVGAVLQLVFCAYFCMPSMWKIPIRNWAVHWSVRVSWQAHPGY